MPEMAGRITQIAISEGQTVSQGQVLVSLFDEDLKAQAKKQELQAEITRKNLSRLKELVKINGVSQQEVENSENQLNNIQSDLNLIQANLKKTRILAPFSGVIGLTNASLGSYITPGNPVASLQQMDMLKVEFSIPEKYTRLLQEGDKVEFTVETSADTFAARVYAFEPKIDAGSRTLKVRARFDNRQARLLPGTFARAHVRLREIRNALLVPTQCVIPETRGKKVVVAKGGHAEFVSVETGIRNKDKVQILSGLSPGDTVLTSGLMFVKPKGEIKMTAVQP
jgi:membrane fusion protein (multidrug efflux system)